MDARAALSERESRLLGRLAWALAGALALALLFVILGPHKIGDYFTETDFYGGYAIGARLIQSGHLDPSRYSVVGPIYEVVLAAIGFVTRDLFLGAELLSLIATSGTLILLFRMVTRRVDARVGLFAALFLATNGWVFRFGYSATTDALAIALQVLTLSILLSKPGARGAAAAGLAAAAAFLTRYNAVYLLPAGLVILWLETPRRQSALYAAAFFTPVIAWVLWCLANGSAFSFQLHHNIAYEVYARHNGIVWDEYQQKLQPKFHNLWDVIRLDPPRFFGRMAINVFDHLRIDAYQLMGWPVAVCVVLGLALAISSGAFGPLIPMAVAGGLLFLSLVPAFYAERYSMALMPFYATYAGLLFGLPRFAFATRGRGVWLKPIASVLPLTVTLLASIGLQLHTLDQLPVEVIEAARALRAVAGPGDAVIARKPHLAYHAGLKAVPFPFSSTIPELAEYAHHEKARWLFVSWPEVETRPAFWHLLDTTGVMPGLRPLHVTRPHPSVIYEVGPEFGQLPAWYANDTLKAFHLARAQLMVDRRNHQALFALGNIYWDTGQPDSARRYLEQAVEVRPQDVHSLVLLGQIALGRHQVPEAQDYFERVARIQPGDVDAQVGLGWTALISGRLEEAAMTWRPVIRFTEDPRTAERMANLYHLRGDQAAEADAITRYRQLMSGDASTP
ncbi:MAG: tetratricopeptide repeat protein [Candidatus Eiseniibacteriota bacterium]